MINAFEDVQKLSQTNVDSAMKVWGDWSRNWQALAAEMGEYSKKSFEESAATFQKLMGAKTLDQAYEIQSSYARRAYEQYFQEVNKIGGMYASLAKEAMKPMERLSQAGFGR